MKTKLSLLFLFFALSATSALAQNNDMKARIEYEDAETAFQNEEYEKVITHLTNAEKLLGKWTAKVSFLKIQALDMVTNYSKWNDHTAELYRQVKEYMKYADKNSDKVDIDRMREMYKIEKKISFSKTKYDFEAAPEYKAGKEAYDKKDYETAMNHYLKAVQKNNTRAMDAISDMYRDAVGVEQDYAKSLEWDTKASKLGDPISTSDIGHMYLDGLGVSQDYKKALEYSLIGAEYEIDYAMYNIGEIYYIGGNGIAQNHTETIKWLKKAADKDYASAMYGLGGIYRNGGIGISKDYQEAMNWFKKAADKGSIDALNYIGLLYNTGGNGIAQNYREAMNWYKKAADKGQVVSMSNIGNMLRTGQGVSPDYQEAISWYEKAINAGHKEAVDLKGHIASCHFKQENYMKAMEYYKKVYEEGNTNHRKVAKDWIAKMYEEGLGVEKDKKKAKEWRNK